jgi:hypothetical protein
VLESNAHRRAVAEGLGLRNLDPAGGNVAGFVDE